MKTCGWCCRPVWVVVLCAVFSPGPASVRAVQHVVTTTADYGAGSLRQTVADATSGDVITFSGALSGQTIALSGGAGQLHVNKSLTIDASSLPGGIAIDGNGVTRILDFPAGTTNVLIGLTLTNGVAVGDWPSNGGSAIQVHSDAVLRVDTCSLSGNTCVADGFGGGIYNGRGLVTVTNCTFSGNYGGFFAGAIYNEGTLTIHHSLLRGNSAYTGGSLCNAQEGTMTIRDTTLSGNSADYGGAIYNTAEMTIHNSTLSGNSALHGGGIQSDTAPVGEPVISRTTLSQCTLAGNTASAVGGGVRNYMGWTFITNCTIVGNTSPSGAGIQSWGDEGTETVVANSIVAGNADSDLDVEDTTNPDAFLSAGCNLIGNGAVSYFDKPGDTTNHTASSVRLASLGAHGGPTETAPPQPGSPAIDAGTSPLIQPATDQRGYPRIVGGTADIGACEFGFAGCFITRCDPSAGGMALRWTAFPLWESAVMYSTNLVTMPFAVLTNSLAYPIDGFTDAVHGTRSRRFYKVEISPR